MAKVKCSACGNRYHYHEHGCCPECGAYNRGPRRDRVEADGTVHHMSDEEFMENGAKRRSSQGGKVCFEQDSCFEDQTRVSRSARQSGKTHNVGKIIAIIAIVIMVCNILPILLTMCSVSGVLGGIVDEVFDSEVGTAVPEPDHDTPADSVVGVTRFINVGETFLWWDEKAVVTEVVMDEGDGVTKVDLTIQQAKPIADPYIQYLLADGAKVTASHEQILLQNENEFIYSFTLYDRQNGSECYALFAGENDDVWTEVRLPLADLPQQDVTVDDKQDQNSNPATPPADDQQDQNNTPAVTPPADLTIRDAEEVVLGKTFLWWGKEARVQKASVHESGSSADVNLTMYRADSFDEPILRYTTVHGAQMMAFCQKTTSLGSGQYSYYFHVTDRKAGTACYALFNGYNDGVYSQTMVPLN